MIRTEHAPEQRVVHQLRVLPVGSWYSKVDILLFFIEGFSFFPAIYTTPTRTVYHTVLPWVTLKCPCIGC